MKKQLEEVIEKEERCEKVISQKEEQLAILAEMNEILEQQKLSLEQDNYKFVENLARYEVNTDAILDVSHKPTNCLKPKEFQLLDCLLCTD